MVVSAFTGVAIYNVLRERNERKKLQKCANALKTCANVIKEKDCNSENNTEK